MKRLDKMKSLSDEIMSDILKTYQPTKDWYLVIKPCQIEVSILYVLHKFAKEIVSNWNSGYLYNNK